MLRSLRIGPRLIFFIAVQLIILAGVSATTLYGLNLAVQSTNQLNRNVSEGTHLSYLAGSIRGELLPTIHGVNTGAISWEGGRRSLRDVEKQFEQDWDDYTSVLSAEEIELVGDTLEPGLADLRTTFRDAKQLLTAEDRALLALFVRNELNAKINPFLNAVLASSAERRLASERTFSESLENSRKFLAFSIAAALTGALLVMVLGVLIYRSISQPIRQISNAVRQVMDGVYDVRTELRGSDEFGELGQGLDTLLDDKMTTLIRAEEENERLNTSILRLVEGVAAMSGRNLTVSVPVANDVTGPVADAINLMAEETGGVLNSVTKIAAQVQRASNLVHHRASSVNKVATSQREEIERTSDELTRASKTLQGISQLARDCNKAAEQATQTTQSAMHTVQGTVEGMGEIRESIQETGRRITRLGERSNEITSIVDIISTLAERTHVLALNAAMQAATAGEAGRGFAVVANEVRRLAESSRESTARIASLVNNIQVETQDTIATMDETIGQVARGSQMAEAAGNQMVQTRETTGHLVNSVKQIAASSEQQARISIELRRRAGEVVERTRATAQELMDQLAQTNKLADYAQQLLASVRVFKLPPSEEPQAQNEPDAPSLTVAPRLAAGAHSGGIE
ncbi:MAG: methyl-accepting chemotaxis protein [Gammaproteobacteria bacterium]